MSKPEVVIAMYRPKAGKAAELDVLVKKHFAVLSESGLTTEQKSFIGRSADGCVLEVFEWVSNDSARTAHDHPAVAKIWAAMMEVCDFGRLEQLPEAKDRFPHFPRAF